MPAIKKPEPFNANNVLNNMSSEWMRPPTSKAPSPVSFGPYTGTWGSKQNNDGGIRRREFVTNKGDTYFLDPKGSFSRWEDSPTFSQEIADVKAGRNASHFTPDMLNLIKQHNYDATKLQQYFKQHPEVNTWKQESKPAVNSPRPFVGAIDSWMERVSNTEAFKTLTAGSQKAVDVMSMNNTPIPAQDQPKSKFGQAISDMLGMIGLFTPAPGGLGSVIGRGAQAVEAAGAGLLQHAPAGLIAAANKIPNIVAKAAETGAIGAGVWGQEQAFMPEGSKPGLRQLPVDIAAFAGGEVGSELLGGALRKAIPSMADTAAEHAARGVGFGTGGAAASYPVMTKQDQQKFTAGGVATSAAELAALGFFMSLMGRAPLYARRGGYAAPGEVLDTANYAPIDTTAPDFFVKQGYKEFKPGTGIWQKVDVNGKEIDRVYEHVLINGQMVPKFKTWRAQRKVINNVVANDLSPEAQQTYKTVVDTYVKHGVDPEEAQDRALNDYENTPGGQQHVGTIVKTAADMAGNMPVEQQTMPPQVETPTVPEPTLPAETPTSPVMPEQPTVVTKSPYQLGQEAFNNGKVNAPGHDSVFLQGLEGLNPSEVVQNLQEWQRGWHEANVNAPITEQPTQQTEAIPTPTTPIPSEQVPQRPVTPTGGLKPVEAITERPSGSTPIAQLPHDLTGAKPRYSYGNKQFTLSFENDLDKAAYITAQTTRSKRDADYLKFVQDATGMDEASVRLHGQKVRDEIKAMARDTDAGELAVPKIFKWQQSKPEAVKPEEVPQRPVPLVETEQAKVPGKIEEVKPTQTPTFNEGDQVSFTHRNGETLTGKIRSYRPERKEALVNVDQGVSPGGVPLGRLEIVPTDKLERIEETKPVEVKSDIVIHGFDKADELRKASIEKMLAGKKAKEAQPAQTKTLADLGLEVTPKTTKNGTPVWHVTGKTLEHKDLIKSLGGKWYKPHPKARGAWSFTADPTEKLLNALAPVEAQKQEAKPVETTENVVQSNQEPGKEAVINGQRTEPNRTEVHRPGAKALEGTPPEDVSGTPAERPVGAIPGERGGTDVTSGTQDNRGPESGANATQGLPEEGGVRGSDTTPSVGDRSGNVDTTPDRGGRTKPGRESTKPAGTNYRITAEDNLGSGGPKQKYRDNVAAIRVLKSLEEEKRLATPEEQATLVKYVGWGGLPQVFGYGTEWAAERDELSKLLTPEEHKTAKASTLNAHYTSKDVIDGMYSALERFGFTGGRILEPSMGIGNFFGLLPPEISAHSRLTGVELDAITGRIAQQLYQTADVRVQGFEETKLPDNFYDIAISNVPFGDYKLHDPKYNKYGFNIHDYFFAKSLDKVRPGGIVAFITSRFTMDKLDTKVRKHINDRADFIGAIRLPNTAFKGNAGTEVVTDIIFLKKREEGSTPTGKSWIETKPATVDGEQAQINEYYAKNPRMMLGNLSLEGSMYSGKELTLKPDDRNINDAINEAVGKLPQNIYEKPKVTIKEVDSAQSLPAPGTLKQDALTVIDGKVYRKNNDQLVPEKVPVAVISRVKGMVEIRDAVHDILRLQIEGKPDAEIEQAQKHLSKIYDGFVKKHGLLNDRANRSAFKEDPDEQLLSSLENVDRKTGKVEKADIFTKKTMLYQKKIESVDTPEEALVVALNEVGSVDLVRIAQLSGKTVEEVRNELTGLIYKNPEGDYEPTDQYLSGNVREKLAVAEVAAKLDPAYLENVEALKAVQPIDLKPAEITVRLGAPWIEAQYVDAFVEHLMGFKSEIKTQHSQITATWALQGIGKWSPVNRSVANTQTWGTGRYSALKIVEDTLNMRIPTVYDSIDDKSVVNASETAMARDKQQFIKDEFERWIWDDAERRTTLSRKYNDEQNNIRQQTFDGKHLTFPGISADIELMPHQKSAIWRIVQTGNALLAHVVGGGKTFSMVAAGMELRRLGLAKKPMYVVPNHMLEQFAGDFRKLYPSANILVASKADFEKSRRQRLMARIATGDWDGVIIAHSSFGRIPMSKDAQMAHIQEQIADFAFAIEQSYAESGKSGNKIVKELEKAKKKLEAKLLDLIDKPRDNTVTFEELGVDQLFIDEAHEFKNLTFATKMGRVAGVGQKASQKASDMFMKTQYVNRINNGRGIVFATGTPISNSMVEMYTMQRYLQSDMLRAHGLTSFDAWAASFGNVVSKLEISPTGAGLGQKSRFAEFVNMTELHHMFRSVADVKMQDALNLKVPNIVGGTQQAVSVEISPEQQTYVEELISRAEAIKAGMVDRKDDNMLVVVTHGKMAALDMRLINSNATDNPGSKLNLCINNVFDIWKNTKKDKLTQVIFCDLGVPNPKHQGFNVYDDIRAKLIKKGVPAEEIAFMQDNKTDAKKKTLFDKVNTGDVRVLLGSSRTLATGANIQTKLYAMHHLDVPWKPAEIEQREGRILRQGNSNEEIIINRYVTKKSFDAYMWQTQERKAMIIAQVMSSDISARTLEDIDPAVLSAAEMKAAASDNPILMKKMEIDGEVRKYQMLKTNHIKARHQMQDDIPGTQHEIKLYSDIIDNVKKDLAVERDTSGEKFAITIKRKRYTKRGEADTALTKINEGYIVGKGSYGDTAEIGEIAGLKIIIRNVFNNEDGEITLRGNFNYHGAKPSTQSIEYQIKHGIESSLKYYEEQLDAAQKRLEGYSVELEKPFVHEEKLSKLQRDQEEINAQLGITTNTESMDIDDNGGVVIPDEDVQCEIPFIPGEQQKGRNLSPKATNRINAIFAASPLGTVLRAGRMSRFANRTKSAATYNEGSGETRVRRQYVDSWRILGHELGHALDKKAGFRADQQEMEDMAFEMYPGEVPEGHEYTEGLAEFVMLWFKDTAMARKMAPVTAEKLDQFLDGNKGLQTAFAEAMAVAAKDLKTSGLSSMANYIAKPGQKVDVNIGEYKLPKWMVPVFKIADFTIPMKHAFAAAKAKGYTGRNPAKLMAIKGAYWRQAVQWFKSLPRTKDGLYILDKGARSLEEIVQAADALYPKGFEAEIDGETKTVSGVQLMDWVYHAMRYQERYSIRDEQGNQKFPVAPMSEEEADAFVAEAEEKHPEIVKLVKEYSNNLSETILRSLVHGEVISEAAADRVREGSHYYLPLYHVGQTSASDTGGKPGPKQPVSLYKGHSSQTMTFLEATMTKLTEVNAATEINRIFHAIENVIGTEGMAAFGRFEDRPIKATARVNAEQIADFFDIEGDIEDEARVMKLFIPGGLKEFGKSEPVIMSRHGDAVRFIRLAPDMFKSVVAMTPVSVELVSKALIGISQVGRLGALFTPRTMTNLFARDTVTSKAQTTTPERSIVLGMIDGIRSAAGIKSKADMDLFVQSGAYGSAVQEVFDDMLRSGGGDGLLATNSPGWKRTTTGLLVKAVRSPNELLRILDEAPRVPEWKAVLNKDLKEVGLTRKDVEGGKYTEGLDEEEAKELAKQVEDILVDGAYASAEIATNFGLHGESAFVRKYARTVSFLHGSIQGIYRAGRQVKDNPKQIGKAMAWMGVLTLIAFALSHDDDRYRDMPSESRDRYWWIPLGKPGSPYYIALAKPYEYAIPVNVAECYLDYYINTDDPNRRQPFEDIGVAFKESFSVPMASMLIETVLGLWTNTNYWGSSITPQREEGLSPELQYGPGNTKAAIKLAEAFARLMGDKAPNARQIDYFMTGVFASPGAEAMRALSVPLKGPGISTTDSGKAGFEYTPVVGGLIYGPGEGGSRIIDKFYNDKKRAGSLYKTAKTYNDRGSTLKVTKREESLIHAIPAFNAINKEISERRNEMQAVALDKNMSAKQKTQASLRFGWIQKVAAGYLYGMPIPKPPAGSGLSMDDGKALIEYYDELTTKAIERAEATPGGPV